MKKMKKTEESNGLYESIVLNVINAATVLCYITYSEAQSR